MGAPDPREMMAMDTRQIQVSLDGQRLWLLDTQGVLGEWSISSARNGPGERSGSECTPRGWHGIAACIGAGCTPGTVFVGRRPTGEIYAPELARAQPERDWILTRILWLRGLQPGHNRLGQVDSMRRYIYIHGCPDECPMGVPQSHGCIRMRNHDVIELFEQVEKGTRVWIQEAPLERPAWRVFPGTG
jgi:L,D-transpeptidase YbiS